jgi:hypothetical protein
MGYLIVLPLGLLFPTDKVLATGLPNLEFSVSILSPVRFRAFGH